MSDKVHPRNLGPLVKFNNHSDEKICGVAIMGLLDGKYDAELGGMACMRTSGHDGEHEALVGKAAEMDGVRHCCRVPLASHHEPWCIGLDHKVGKHVSET